MMKRAKHCACPRGKAVVVVLRDGTRIQGRFLGRTDRQVVLDVGRIDKSLIRSFLVGRHHQAEKVRDRAGGEA